jgi:hypothetical protein
MPQTSAYQITPELIQAWLTHWLTTPPEAYLGSGYGFDANALLMRSFSAGIADGAIAKLRRDIPLLGEMPSSAFAVYGEQIGVDTLFLTFEVGAAEVSAFVKQNGGVASVVPQN